ncbi:hypothetical protein D3C72_2376910 [compost metagenome]
MDGEVVRHAEPSCQIQHCGVMPQQMVDFHRHRPGQPQGLGQFPELRAGAEHQITQVRPVHDLDPAAAFGWEGRGRRGGMA